MSRPSKLTEKQTVIHSRCSVPLWAQFEEKYISLGLSRVGALEAAIRGFMLRHSRREVKHGREVFHA